MKETSNRQVVSILLAILLVFTGFAIPDFSYGLENDFMRNLQIGANVQALYGLSKNQDDEENTYTVLIPIEKESKSGILVKLKDDYQDTGQTYNFLQTDGNAIQIVRYDNTTESITNGCSSEQLKSGIYLKNFLIKKDGNGASFQIKVAENTYIIKVKRYCKPTAVKVGADTDTPQPLTQAENGNYSFALTKAAASLQMNVMLSSSMAARYAEVWINNQSVTPKGAQFVQQLSLAELEFQNGTAVIPIAIKPNSKQGAKTKDMLTTQYSVQVKLAFDDLTFSSDAAGTEDYQLTPSFSKDHTEYTLVVPNTDEKIFVRGISADNGEMKAKYAEKEVSIPNNYAYTELQQCISAGENGGNISFQMGEESYNIRIVRNPTLDNLEVKDGNNHLRLDRTFSKGSYQYYAFVPEAVGSVNIVGSYDKNACKLFVGNEEATSGSYEYQLDWGKEKKKTVSLTLQAEGRNSEYQLTFLKGDSDSPFIVEERNIDNTTTYTKTQIKNKETKELEIHAVVPNGGRLSYQWERLYDGWKVQEYGTIQDAKGKTFKLQGDWAAGTWTLRCKVTNTVGTQQYTTYSQACTIFVDAEKAEKPVFRYLSENPKGYKLMQGGNAETLDATVSYDDGGTAEYQWYENDTNSTENGTKIESSTDPEFVPPTTETGIKYYYCVVVHKVQKYSETVTSTPIKVEVVNAKDLLQEKGIECEGTEKLPFKINTETDLGYIRSLVGEGYSFDGSYFSLQQDIPLSKTWKPIGQIAGQEAGFDLNDKESKQYTYTGKGTKLLPFSGIFDGNGKTVTVADRGLPLFGICRNATIKNLYIAGQQISSNGLIQNYVVDYGTDGDYNTGCPMTATIENVTIKANTSILRSGFLSGYASGANTVNIINCEIEKGVTIGYNRDQNKIGSFAGQFNGNIINSKSAADVYGINAVGGLIGCKGQSMGPCMVKTSSFTGNVVASGARAGGIIGSGYDASSAPNTPVVTIRNCFVDGDVTGTTEVGGILGSEPVCEDCWANGQGSIVDNVFYGKVTATDSNAYVGGIIGFMKSYNENQTMNNNYYVDTCGVNKGIGKVEILKVSSLDLTKCGNAVSATEMSDRTVVKKLNESSTSYKNWVQGAKLPVHSDTPVAYEIEISGSYKTTFYTGDTFDSAGIVITANYSDGSSKMLSEEQLKKVEFSGFSSETAGYKTIFVRYGALETSYEVKVIYQAPRAIEAYISIFGDIEHAEGITHTLKEGGLIPWVDRTSVIIDQNTTVRNVLEKVALRNKIILDTNPNSQYGYYVKGMTKDGKYLAEFTNGKNSGWMYTVNGTHPQVSAGYYFVKDGDEIIWHYTDDYTKEEGSDKWGTPGADEVKDVTTSGASGSATTTSPTEVKVSGTTATATVKAENQSEILKQAVENKSAEIVLEVAASDTKGAENVQLQLETSFVKNISDKTNARLTLNTANGRVSFDQEALKAIIGEAKGSTILIEIAKVTKPTEAQKKAAGTNGDIFRLVVKSGDKIISEFNKGKATVRVEIPAKLADKKVAAIHIADDGKIEQLAGKVLTIGGKKYYEFTTPHFSTFALVDADELGLEVKEEPAVDVKTLTAKLTPIARSAKTAKKNVKVTVRLDKQDKAIIKELKDAGYTVKYRFYRSTKKAAGYKAAVTKKTTSYTNTSGKKGTKYFYKVQVRVYDENGKLAAKTALKQCKYASRTWTKGK